MNQPYLRPAFPEGTPSPDCPPGRQAEPAGVWHGQAMEVVYDPARHDVVFLRGEQSTAVHRGLAGNGYESVLIDGPNQMWVRDRIALARRRLERVPPPATGVRIA